MARPLHSMYGPESSQPQKARATKGGMTMADKRDVRRYQPPQGPSNIGDRQGPGLHGSNAGNANCPTATDGSSGKVGLGGQNSGIRTRPRS